MNRPTTDTALLAYLDARGTDGSIPDDAQPGWYAVRLRDITVDEVVVAELALGELYIGGDTSCTARRWDVTRHAPLRLAAPDLPCRHPGPENSEGRCDRCADAAGAEALRQAVERARDALEEGSRTGDADDMDAALQALDRALDEAALSDAALRLLEWARLMACGHPAPCQRVGPEGKPRCMWCAAEAERDAAMARAQEAEGRVAKMQQAIIDKVVEGALDDRMANYHAWAVAAMTRVAELEARLPRPTPPDLDWHLEPAEVDP